VGENKIPSSMAETASWRIFMAKEPTCGSKNGGGDLGGSTGIPKGSFLPARA
jgi:hypothetical protein